jgi:hypothetical protein
LSRVGGEWKALHDCSNEGLGFPITTTKEVYRNEAGRIVPVEATVAKEELTRALVFNPLSATFAGIAAILGFLTYAIDPCLCLSIVSALPKLLKLLLIFQLTYIMLVLSSSCAWIAFAINITITLRSKAKVNDFATKPNQTMTLKIGPTSWIALAGAVSQIVVGIQDRKADLEACPHGSITSMDGRRHSETGHARGPKEDEGHVDQELTGIPNFHRVLYPGRFKKNQLSITSVGSILYK